MTNKPLKIILIHGAGGTKDKWRAVLPFLHNESIVNVDLPAHGDNLSEPKQSIEAFAEDLAKEIKEDCIVAGHSMGGLIALELAAKSDYVKGIALVATSFVMPVHPSIIESLSDGVFPEFLFKASYGKDAGVILLEEEKKQVNDFPADVAQKDFQACSDYKNGEKVLKELEKPVIAILGEEDKLVPKGTADAFHMTNPNVAVQMVQGAGHYNLLETPEKVSDAILRFKTAVEAAESI